MDTRHRSKPVRKVKLEKQEHRDAMTYSISRFHPAKDVKAAGAFSMGEVFPIPYVLLSSPSNFQMLAMLVLDTDEEELVE